MKSKKWLSYWFVSILVSVPILIGVNYIVDPLNILHTKFFKQEYQMNERFMKIEFLKANHKKYNSYMFGSSKIGTTYPKDIEKYIQKSKFYNLTVSSGNLADYIKHLKFFIKEDFKVDNLYLQIDGGDMGYYGNSHLGNLGKYYPEVVGESLTMFYIDYLTSFSPLSVKGKILRNFKNININDNAYDLNKTGMFFKRNEEKQLNENCDKYVENQASFHIKNYRAMSALYINEAISSLKEIVSICKDNNISLYVFTAPINNNLMDTMKINDYLGFLSSISKVTNFTDFSGYNTITMNNCNYYESHHYRPLVGQLVAARIFNDSTVDIPSDFGVYVTKNNINEHLEKLREQIKYYDINKTLFE